MTPPISQHLYDDDNDYCHFSTDSAIPIEVLTEMKAGNPGAFKTIYLRYYTQIENFLRKLLNSAEDGSDMAQETFIRLWEKRDQINPQGNIKSYIFTIARNLAYNYITRKRGGVFSDANMQTINSVMGDSEASDKIEAEDMQLLLNIALFNMPGQRREVYELFCEGLSNEEIAERLGTSRQVVYQQLSKARKDISELLLIIMFFVAQ